MSELQIEGQDLKVGQAVAWELTAEELIYPFQLQVGSKTAPLFVHLKPYRADDLKKLLAETASAVKYEDDDISEIVKSKPEKITAFFWKHFIRISGHGRASAEGDPNEEKQRQWIRDNPRFDIPHKAVMDGFGGIATKVEPEIESDEPATNGNGNHSGELDIFALDFEVTKSIVLTQRLYVPEIGIADLEMAHNFRRETAAEYRRYEQATDKQLINRKRQAYQRSVNHDVIENLYNELAESVEGMTIKGEPCVIANKSKWAPLVPYWHKQLALMKFFSGIQSKNG
jgi:hypothetical protein